MTREELIDIILEDHINDIIHTHNEEMLKEILYWGWKGYNDYTDGEIYEAFSILNENNFDKETALKIRKQKRLLQLD